MAVFFTFYKEIIHSRRQNVKVVQDFCKDRYAPTKFCCLATSIMEVGVTIFVISVICSLIFILNYYTLVKNPR